MELASQTAIEDKRSSSLRCADPSAKDSLTGRYSSKGSFQQFRFERSKEMLKRSLLEVNALRYMSARMKMSKLQKEMEELEAVMADLESKHPEIGNLKGILRRWKAKEGDEESEEEEAPDDSRGKRRKTEKSEQEKKQKGTTARSRIQKKINMDNNKQRVSGAHPRAEEFASS
jgi:hypothetical protein